MERYTIKQHVFIVEWYFKSNESLKATVRKFCTKYGRNSDLTSSVVNRIIEKLRQTVPTGDAKQTGCPKRSRLTVNIDTVRESVEENTERSNLWMKAMEVFYVLFHT